MADQYQYQHHAHYRSEHVELPMARSTSDFHSPTQPYKGSPYQSEQEHDQKDYESQYSLAKIPTLDSERGYTSPPQRPVYPTAHKDVSYTSDFSDARSIATSRYPGFNTQAQLPPDAGVQEKQPGFLSRVLPSSIACRLYLLVVLIETIVDIAIESDLLVLVNGANLGDSLETRRLPVYLVVFALAHLAQLLLALDAVHAQNTLQFMFLAAFNAAILAYAVVQKAEINAIINSDTDGLANIPVDALTIIIICVVSLSQVAYIGLAWKIYTEFGWKVYKLLGADRGIKRMYMHLQVFLCLCKFDVIFFIGFGVQWLYLVLEQKDFEYWVTIAALPFSVVVLAIGYRAAHNENKWLMGAFIAGSTAACVYFVYKSWKILAFRNDETYRPLFKSLMTFSALSTILLVVTFAWAMIVMHNFGHGLKARVAKHKTGASVAFSTRTGRAGNQFEMRTHPNRLSID